jgi:phosphoribosylanthranilate isomerase
MRLKICGLMQKEQCQAIAALGVHALGFIGVPESKRYLTPEQVRMLTADLPPFVARIGVFADLPLADLLALVPRLHLSGVQLHGNESPAYCQHVREQLPGYEIIKALRLRSVEQLHAIKDYAPHITAVLLDAYQPDQLGGTGQRLDWQLLANFQPPVPWILAGGLTVDNIQEAVTRLQPSGLDLSSSVERAPGDKDLEQVKQLWQVVKGLG